MSGNIVRQMPRRPRPARTAIILSAAILASALATAQSAAQAVADEMTCAQAVNHYERNGRIYKIAHGTDVIPIYNGVPVSQRNSLHCGFGYMRTGYSLKTTDNRRCTISYQCVPSGFD